MGRHALAIAQGDLALGVGAELRRRAGPACLRHLAQDRVGELDRRRHQLRRLAAGKAEHQPLVARPLVLVADGIDPHRDVGRLGVQQDLDLRPRPVKARLLVADVAHRVARQLLDVRMGDPVDAPHLTGDDDAIGGRQRLHGDAGGGIGAEKRIEDGIRDPIADLVRMALGDGFAGEQVVGCVHEALFGGRRDRLRSAARSYCAQRSPRGATVNTVSLKSPTSKPGWRPFLCRRCEASGQGGRPAARYDPQRSGAIAPSRRLPSALVSSNSRLRTAGSAIR